MDSSDRKGAAQYQRVGACSNRISQTGFLEHALGRRLIREDALPREHDRNAVADRIGKLGRAGNKFLILCVIFERRLGPRTHQDFKQPRIDPRRSGACFPANSFCLSTIDPSLACAFRGSTDRNPLRFSAGCRFVFPARKFDFGNRNEHIRRPFRSRASRSACFSFGLHGLIMESALTSASFGALWMLFQSTGDGWCLQSRARCARRRRDRPDPRRHGTKSTKNGLKSARHCRYGVVRQVFDDLEPRNPRQRDKVASVAGFGELVIRPAQPTENRPARRFRPASGSG